MAVFQFVGQGRMSGSGDLPYLLVLVALHVLVPDDYRNGSSDGLTVEYPAEDLK